MLLHQNNFDVQVSGAASEQSQFSIAMNAKAFRVLSDNLYEDKIGSIVREISTNAYDAHIMADKKDQPFEIHLPDNFEPWFSVKDFGVGLSPQQVQNVFCVYFASSKDQSNDTVGAFGLGAKTPFAYTDQFTVTSIFDGTKYLYSAFINAQGIPNITLMHSEETSECNGVEINLSVKSLDFQAFRQAVAWQLRFFKIKPIVKNASNFQFPELYRDSTSKIEGKDYLVVPGQQTYRADVVVIQGQVGYPVDVSKITSKVNPQVSSLLQRGIFVMLEMPIGTVGVTASREGIEYDDRTVENIAARLLEVQQDIQKNIEKNLAEIKKPWNRLKVINSLYSHFVSTLGVKLPNVVNKFGKLSIETKESKYNWYSKNQHFRGVIAVDRIEAEDNVCILLVDSSKAKPFAVDNLCNQGFKKIYYCFIQKDTDVAKLKKDLQKYFLGFDQFFVQSDFKEPRKPRTAAPRSTYLSSNGTSDTTQWYRNPEKELPEKFIYVEVERNRCSEEDKQAIRDYQRLYNVSILKDAISEFEDYDLIALPKSSMKKIEGLDCKSIKEVVEELKSKIDLYKVRKMLIRSTLKSSAYGVVTQLDGKIRQAVTESKTDLAKMYAVAQKACNREVSSDATILAQVFQKELKSKLQDKLVVKFFDEKKKYPILRLSSFDLRNFSEDELTKFVQIKS